MTYQRTNGTLVVSLDFELFWGMADVATLESYGQHILGERRAIPRMLDLFATYGIHATWATVGMLTFETKADLLAALPSVRPAYEDRRLSNYAYLEGAEIGTDEASDPYHFGPSLVRAIASYPGQEIASHTFSHYYCLERGQDAAAFRADISASIRALSRFGVKVTSLVLPRNQWREDYLPVCVELGIRAFRGNQRSFIYAAREEKRKAHPALRALRLVDQYVPLTGPNARTREEVQSFTPRNIAASMFLRPYHPSLRALEPLRAARLRGAMTSAARSGSLFHLWWHPHNFGLHTEENLHLLEGLLEHFARLRERYGMESRSMGEVAEAEVIEMLS